MSATFCVTCTLLATGIQVFAVAVPLSSSLPTPANANLKADSTGVCVDDYDDVEQMLLLQIRADFEQALIDKGITPAPTVSSPCRRRRFLLNAIDVENCANDAANDSRCFQVPSFFQQPSQRVLLRVHKHADDLDAYAQSLSITEYYTVDGRQEKVTQILELPNRPEPRKKGWFQAQLRGPAGRNQTAVLHHVSVRCTRCSSPTAVDEYASLDFVARQSPLLSRQKRSAAHQSANRKNLNTVPCQLRDFVVDLRKLDRNIVHPDGPVGFTFCAGYCTADANFRQTIVHRFSGMAYACCTPTAIEKLRVEVRNGTGFTRLELPVRVTGCRCN